MVFIPDLDTAVIDPFCVVPHQKAYHVAKPFDRSYECRSKMCLEMEKAGIPIKYIIHNTSLKYGKTATFMPKPVYGKAGNGMHVHMLLLKDGEPVFSDDNGYATCNPYLCYAAILMSGLDGVKKCMQMAAIPHPAEFEKYFNL